MNQILQPQSYALVFLYQFLYKAYTPPTEEKKPSVTLEELESKFPVEPEYPELQLKEDYDLEVNLKADLLTLDVTEGTIVKTKGYYAANDGGQAVYEIMSYDDFCKYGSEKEVKENGKMRLEGKDYLMQDGDICYFRFNV